MRPGHYVVDLISIEVTTDLFDRWSTQQINEYQIPKATGIERQSIGEAAGVPSITGNVGVALSLRA